MICCQFGFNHVRQGPTTHSGHWQATATTHQEGRSSIYQPSSTGQGHHHHRYNVQLPPSADSLTFNPGANSALGIGRATAHQYAESGARAIYICDFDDSNLAAHKQELTASFPSVEIHTRKFDAADEARVKGVVDDAIKRYGRLDVFFANAGVVGRSVLFKEFTDDEFMSILKTNTLRHVERIFQ